MQKTRHSWWKTHFLIKCLLHPPYKITLFLGNKHISTAFYTLTWNSLVQQRWSCVSISAIFLKQQILAEEWENNGVHPAVCNLHRRISRLRRHPTDFIHLTLNRETRLCVWWVAGCECPRASTNWRLNTSSSDQESRPSEGRVFVLLGEAIWTTGRGLTHPNWVRSEG